MISIKYCDRDRDGVWTKIDPFLPEVTSDSVEDKIAFNNWFGQHGGELHGAYGCWDILFTDDMDATAFKLKFAL